MKRLINLLNDGHQFFEVATPTHIKGRVAITAIIIAKDEEAAKDICMKKIVEEGMSWVRDDLEVTPIDDDGDNVLSCFYW